MPDFSKASCISILGIKIIHFYKIFMKKIFLLLPAYMLLFCLSAYSQNINTDSLTLISQISADKLKLAKLQNQIEEKTNNKQDASEQAQISADANASAATKLSNNPENKQLAKKADNKAGDAKSEARNARKEARRLENLMKDISKMKSKISIEENKLKNYTPVTMIK
jgi:cell division septum initiation protein DivIVA